MSNETSRGRFIWYDLSTTDPAAAEGFYGSVIGWGTQPYGGDTPYTMWTVEEKPIGGVMELPEEAARMGTPPHWIGYISTPDVDATTAQAKELGGTVLVGPEDIPSVGRFVIMEDPQGAVISAFQPASDAPGDPGGPRVGDMSWHELASDDPAASFSFYHELFGWEQTAEHDMGEMGVYQMFGLGDTTLGGIYRKPPEMPGPSAWLYYTRVLDVNEAVARARAHGGQVLNGPLEVPGGDQVAQCMDSQGAMFAVHQRVAGGEG